MRTIFTNALIGRSKEDAEKIAQKHSLEFKFISKEQVINSDEPFQLYITLSQNRVIDAFFE